MGRSRRVREEDVRAMLAMMGEVAELPTGGAGRVEHLLAGVARLTGASVSFTTRFRSLGRGRGIEPYAAVQRGWEGREFGEALRVAAFDPLHGFINDALHEDASARGGAAGQFAYVPHRMAKEQVQARAGAAEQFVNGTGGDIDLVVLNPAGHGDGHYAALGLSRQGSPRRPFTAREIQIARLMWEAADALHRVPLSAFEERLWGTRLPPRAAQVLDALRAGLSVKEVAGRLDLSPHTVNEHVKSIYRRFGVSSRGELMALLASRQP